jgi:hypothetical protein
MAEGILQEKMNLARNKSPNRSRRIASPKRLKAPNRPRRKLSLFRLFRSKNKNEEQLKAVMEGCNEDDSLSFHFYSRKEGPPAASPTLTSERGRTRTPKEEAVIQEEDNAEDLATSLDQISINSSLSSVNKTKSTTEKTVELGNSDKEDDSTSDEDQVVDLGDMRRKLKKSGSGSKTGSGSSSSTSNRSIYSSMRSMSMASFQSMPSVSTIIEHDSILNDDDASYMTDDSSFCDSQLEESSLSSFPPLPTTAEGPQITRFGGAGAPFRHIPLEHHDNIAGTTLDILDPAIISVAAAPDKQQRRWETDGSTNSESSFPPVMILRQTSEHSIFRQTSESSLPSTLSPAAQEKGTFPTVAFKRPSFTEKTPSKSLQLGPWLFTSPTVSKATLPRMAKDTLPRMVARGYTSPARSGSGSSKSMLSSESAGSSDTMSSFDNSQDDTLSLGANASVET